MVLMIQQLEAEVAKRTAVDDPQFALKAAYRDGRIDALRALVELVDHHVFYEDNNDSPTGA